MLNENPDFISRSSINVDQGVGKTVFTVKDYSWF